MSNLPPGQKIVDKIWGKEIWIVNNELYCGKILELNKDYFCSFHSHKLKTESFYILSGLVLMFFNKKPEYDPKQTKLLKTGDSFHIPVGLWHRFLGMEDSRILEISTQHFDSDSYRIRGSGKKSNGFCPELWC